MSASPVVGSGPFLEHGLRCAAEIARLSSDPGAREGNLTRGQWRLPSSAGHLDRGLHPHFGEIFSFSPGTASQNFNTEVVFGALRPCAG